MQFSIVNYNDLDSIAFRLDPEFYHPENLFLVNTLKQKPHKKISELAFVTDGIHESISFSEDKEILLISAKAPKENYFETSGLGYICKKQNEKNPRTKLKLNDIILSTVGTIGNCAVVDESILPANSDRHVGIIRIRGDKYKPRYLSSFLLSKYGRLQTNREATGNVQLNLFIYKINELIIPDLKLHFQDLIENACLKAESCLRNSENKFTEAQDILLSELGLLNWKPKHKLSYVKNFFEVQKAGRFDAEYFQPKYEEIIEHIKSDGYKKLGDLVSIKKSVEVGSDEYAEDGIPFVRVSNLSPFELTEEKYISEELYNSLRQHQPKKDEILLSKDATPCIAHHLSSLPKRMILSGGILRLKLKSDVINPEYLTLVMNSILCQEQMKRDVGGSVILHWRPEQIKDVTIPILDKETQLQIKEKITESFKLRKQSKHLLECAKKAVEMAIEENEEAAIKWLEETTER